MSNSVAQLPGAAGGASCSAAGAGGLLLAIAGLGPAPGAPSDTTAACETSSLHAYCMGTDEMAAKVSKPLSNTCKEGMAASTPQPALPSYIGQHAGMQLADV